MGVAFPLFDILQTKRPRLFRHTAMCDHAMAHGPHLVYELSGLGAYDCLRND